MDQATCSVAIVKITAGGQVEPADLVHVDEAALSTLKRAIANEEAAKKRKAEPAKGHIWKQQWSDTSGERGWKPEQRPIGGPPVILKPANIDNESNQRPWREKGPRK